MDTIIQTELASVKRGPYRRHTEEFKRTVVARSLTAGTSVSRVAREFNVNANQVFAWRRQFSDAVPEAGAGPACQLLPVVVSDAAPAASVQALPQNGTLLLTVGQVQLRIEGAVDAATLELVLARILR